MKLYPELSEALRLGRKGNFKSVPVSCEMLADLCTPIQMVRKLKKVSTHVFMLESAEAQENWGRYTFLGFDPRLSISCVEGRMKIGDLEIETEDPSRVLRGILAEHRAPRLPGLPPFTGGLVGYFSFDYLGYSEPSIRRETEDIEHFQDMDLMLFDRLIIFDHYRQKIILVVHMDVSEGEAGYHRAEMALRQIRDLVLSGTEVQEQPGRMLGEVTALFDEERFCAMVEKATVYSKGKIVFTMTCGTEVEV